MSRRVGWAAWVAAAGLPGALVLGVATGSSAVDGVVEISQACAQTGCLAGDASGFPVTISQPGSYRLTSNLSPSGSATAIVVGASFVTLDLNGFAVLGTGASGSTGIATDAARHVTVRDGSVSGFEDCVQLGSDSRVESVQVESCAGTGVAMGESGLVVRSQIRECNRGLSLAGDVAYADDVLSANGTHVIGGVALSPSSCDGKLCAGPVRRRYYLTVPFYDGANADEPGVCAPGFHFASLYEIFDPSSLDYDTDLGETLSDSGEGPPAMNHGWVRTGNVALAASGTFYEPNCAAWSSNVAGDRGIAAVPQTDWDSTSPIVVSPWRVSEFSCAAPIPVWCVQD